MSGWRGFFDFRLAGCPVLTETLTNREIIHFIVIKLLHFDRDVD